MQASDLILSPDLSATQARAFLKRYGFQHPDQVDRRLQAIAERFSNRQPLAQLMPRLLEALGDSVDPDGALLQLERFLEVSGSWDAMVAFLGGNEAALEVLATLFGSSSFLTLLLQRNPEYFYWLMSAGRLEQAPPSGYFLEQCRSAQGFENLDNSLAALRRIHRREYLRIAAQDLLGVAPLPEIVRQVSELAEAVLQTVFELLFPRHASPQDTFAVIAMGKLGGRELNFSSDVDLVYVFSDDGDPARMTRFSRQYTKRLGEITGEGRLYRVDLRLRPMGRGGEIAYPMAAYRHYWETGAETFERLALIKARAVAGDAELGREFEQHAQLFVYRRYLDQAALEEIAFLKRRSDRKVERRGAQERDVKLGVGGIREIEFFVQALQILYGGRHPELRMASTLGALERLVDGGFIELDDYHSLKEAYLFLRTVEHRLQLVHDRQVQAVPTDPSQLRRLARQMGGEGGRQDGNSAVADFEGRLKRHQQKVRALFQSLLEGESASGLRRLMLDPSVDRELAMQTLQEEGLSNPGDLWDALEQLKLAATFPHTPARMRNLLANLLPRMLPHATGLNHPERLVNRLDRFCQSLGSRVAMYQGLVEDPELSQRLFRMLSLGDYLAETLVRHPELLDALARGENGESSLASSLAPGDPGQRTLTRALFKRREEFKIAARELQGEDTHGCRGDLSRLADQCLQDACEQWTSGHPEFAESRWTLFALGKLGGRELTYHSDLDLILVYSDLESAISPPHWDGLARWLKQELESYTPEGRCYALDFRLRPEGRKSALATPLQQAITYFESRAEGWERLAYLKLRPVFQRGESIDPGMLLSSRPLAPAEVESVMHLRRRKELELGKETAEAIDFKVGLGGMMDVLLKVQVAQLEHGIVETNTRIAIDRLAATGGAEAPPIGEWWDFLFRLESAVRLLSQRSSSSLSRGDEAARLSARLLGLENAEALWDRYTRQRGEVRKAFRTFFATRVRDAT